MTDVTQGVHMPTELFAGPWLGGLLADALGIRLMFGVTAIVCLAPGILLTGLLDGRTRPAR